MDDIFDRTEVIRIDKDVATAITQLKKKRRFSSMRQAIRHIWTEYCSRSDDPELLEALRDLEARDNTGPEREQRRASAR